MKRLVRWFTFVGMVAAAVAAATLAMRHAGLIDGLDFGCGQYYYTDIPDWQKYFSGDGVGGSVPFWVCFLLFALWGCLVYLAWVWIDRNGRK